VGPWTSLTAMARLSATTGVRARASNWSYGARIPRDECRRAHPPRRGDRHFPCLRVAGAFIASCDHRTGDLIVKLPRDRVARLIAEGVGKPFAPAGRTFREWVLVDDRDETRWSALIDEARTFVRGQP
jgi:hypothetical protein